MADHPDIIDEIEALATHCRPPLMSVEQRQRWVVDWATDLAEFPISAIRATFRKWRQGDSGKFPTPGQILPMIRSAMPREGRAEKPWSYDIDDDVYRALSLNDKIRHHRIAAGYCRGKAGPMWGAGRRKSAEELPDIWRFWRQRAAHHDAEVKRLQAVKRDAEMRA